MCDTCFGQKANPTADWSRRLRNTQVSPCLSSVNLCTCVQATQRGAQTKETREMRSCSETNKNLYSVHITFGAKKSNFVFCNQTPRRAHLPRDTRTSFCRVHVDQGESQTWPERLCTVCINKTLFTWFMCHEHSLPDRPLPAPFPSTRTVIDKATTPVFSEIDDARIMGMLASPLFLQEREANTDPSWVFITLSEKTPCLAHQLSEQAQGDVSRCFHTNEFESYCSARFI